MVSRVKVTSIGLYEFTNCIDSEVCKVLEPYSLKIITVTYTPNNGVKCVLTKVLPINCVLLKLQSIKLVFIKTQSLNVTFVKVELLKDLFSINNYLIDKSSYLL